MKKKTCRLLGIMAAMILVSGQVWAAQIVSKVEDASVALRVKNGYTTTLTIVVATNGEHIVVTAGGLATTLTAGTTYDTITELAAGIAACTNAAGTASLTVNSEPSLLADSTDDELLDGTYTATAGNWLELLWDTSAHLSYDLYFPSRTYQSGVSAYILGTVQGVPGGTGNATLSVYKNRVLIGQQVYTSPKYVLTLDPSTNAADAVVNLDWVLNMPFSGTEAVIVRATRATTATTGVLGAVIPNP